MSGVLGYLGAALVHGTAVAALALAVERLLRPWLSPATAGLLWAAALLKFLVPSGPAVPFSFSSAVDSARALALEPLGVVGATGAEAAGEAPWVPSLLAAHGAVVLALLAGRLFTWRRLARQVAALPEAPPEVVARARAAAAALGLRRVPAVRLGEGAFVLGLLRPTLVLPAALAGAPALEPVLLHELAHLRRGDPWVRLLQVVAGAVYWFWPPVAWVGRRLELWRELACDQAALAGAGVAPLAYARLLLDARSGALAAAGGAALEMASRTSRLEARIDALLRLRPARPARGRLLALGAWAALTLGGSALGLDGGTSLAEGSLEKEAIQAVLRGGTTGVSSCYEAGLATDPALQGKVVLGWTVAADGRVKAARVVQADYGSPSSTAVQGQLERCLVKAISALRFPAPTGGAVEVLYPFAFSSQPR